MFVSVKLTPEVLNKIKRREEFFAKDRYNFTRTKTVLPWWRRMLLPLLPLKQPEYEHEWQYQLYHSLYNPLMHNVPDAGATVHLDINEWKEVCGHSMYGFEITSQSITAPVYSDNGILNPRATPARKIVIEDEKNG